MVNANFGNRFNNSKMGHSLGTKNQSKLKRLLDFQKYLFSYGYVELILSDFNFIWFNPKSA